MTDNVRSLYGNTTIYRAYKVWDDQNPGFYPLFVQFTKQLIAAGRRNIGVSLVWERIRWESAIRTVGEPWTLNNNYRAIYARRFMVDFPQYGDVFRVRDTGRVKQAA